MNIYNKETGLRILNLRMDRGYSRETLAELANVSAKFIYEIEMREKGFSAATLKKLADALEVSCDYILTGCGDARYNENLASTIERFEPSVLNKVEELLHVAYDIAHHI